MAGTTNPTQSQNELSRSEAVEGQVVAREARGIQEQIAVLTAREAIHFLINYPGPSEGDDVDAAVRGWVRDRLRARIRAAEHDLPPDLACPLERRVN